MAIKYNSQLQMPQQTQKKSFLQGGIGVLGKIGDVLSRGQYAAANIAKQKVREVKAQPTIGRKISAVAKSYIPLAGPLSNLSNKQTRLAAIRGIKGQDKTGFKEVLTEAGVGDLGKVRVPFTKDTKISGKGALGFAMDIAFDPTTYLTGGTGVGAKISTKTGGKTLTKVGTSKLLQQEAKLGSRQLAERAIAKEIQSSPKIARQLVDVGGIKFAGTTIPGTEKVLQPLAEGIREKAFNLVSRDKQLGYKNLAVRRMGQEYRDLQSGLTNIADREQKQAFKKINAKESEQIVRAIYDKNIGSLTPKLQTAAKYAQKEFSNIAKQEQEKGLLGDLVKNYVTQYYKEGVKPGQIGRKANLAIPRLATSKERKLVGKTYDEYLAKARAAGLEPEMDIRKILLKRKADSIKQVEKANLYENIKQYYKSPENVPAGEKMVTMPTISQFKEPTGRYTALGTEIKRNIKIPENVGHWVDGLQKNPIDSEEVNKLLKGYDNVQNTLKASLTVAFPSFHVRNMVSNVMQNWLDTGFAQAVNPKLHLAASKIVSNKGLGAKITLYGKEYTLKELRDLVDRNGVITGAGYFDVKGKTAMPGTSVGRAIENESRVTNFLANMMRIGDPVTSAERTKKFLFDYDNLNQAEKVLMKRVFPFWTWSSKNFALQAEQLVKQPGKFATQFKVQRDIQKELGPEISEEEYNSLPEWMRNTFIVKVPGENGKFTYKYQFGTPVEEFASTVSAPLQKGLGMLSPLIKYPIEAGTGYDFFQKKPISEVTDAKNIKGALDIAGVVGLRDQAKSLAKLGGYEERPAVGYKGEQYTQTTANPRLLHLLRQAPFSRFGSIAGQITDEGKTGVERATKLFTGISSYTTDKDTQDYYAKKQLKEDLAKQYTQKGLIKSGQFGYFVNKRIGMSDQERAESNYVVKLLNESDSQKKLSAKDRKVLIINSLLKQDPNNKDLQSALFYATVGRKPKKAKSGGSKTAKYVKTPSVKLRTVKTSFKKVPKISTKVTIKKK